MYSTSCANNHDITSFKVDVMVWNIKIEYLKNEVWIFRELKTFLNCLKDCIFWNCYFLVKVSLNILFDKQFLFSKSTPYNSSHHAEYMPLMSFITLYSVSNFYLPAQECRCTSQNYGWPFDGNCWCEIFFFLINIIGKQDARSSE